VWRECVLDIGHNLGQICQIGPMEQLLSTTFSSSFSFFFLFFLFSSTLLRQKLRHCSLSLSAPLPLSFLSFCFSFSSFSQKRREEKVRIKSPTHNLDTGSKRLPSTAGRSSSIHLVCMGGFCYWLSPRCWWGRMCEDSCHDCDTKEEKASKGQDVACQQGPTWSQTATSETGPQSAHTFPMGIQCGKMCSKSAPLLVCVQLCAGQSKHNKQTHIWSLSRPSLCPTDSPLESFWGPKFRQLAPNRRGISLLWPETMRQRRAGERETWKRRV